jgi:hypothetical protein
MAKPKIAIIISTTRATRFGEKAAKWIHGITAARTDMSVELIDLREYPMPFFDEPASNMWVPSKNERRASVECSASVGLEARLKISDGRMVQGWIIRSGADRYAGDQRTGAQ